MSPSGITQWQEFLSGSGSRKLPNRGATEDQLRATEQRLGTSLPPSLRTFLAYSNGWRNQDGQDELDELDGLCSTDELRWTNDAAHDLVDLWCSFEEIIELIARCLVVLDRGDGRYGLVDAARPAEDGEWTAYAWAARDGLTPRPFPNFSALVQALVSGDLPEEEPAA